MVRQDLIATIFSLQFLQHLSFTAATSDWNYYDGSGEDYPGFADFPRSYGRCYSKSCTFHKPICCDEIQRCCSKFEHDLLFKPYEGHTKSCTSDWGGYTGTVCPPKLALDKLYCCANGHSCCSSDQMKRQSNIITRGDGDTGVNSIGGIAGLVFLAVIVLGTILTFITRYLKIKVRREHAQAGINSPAYINARNRRNISNNNNEGGSAGQNQNRMFYPEPTPDQLDDDTLTPPPSYAEALATCPVVGEPTFNRQERENDAREELRSSGPSFTPNHQFSAPPNRPQMRPPRRHHNHFESLELTPLAFKNVNARSTPQHHNNDDVTQDGSVTITLPKPDDSSA